MNANDNDVYANIAKAKEAYAQARLNLKAPARLRGAVRRLLRSEEQIGTEHRLTSGRFDRRALVRCSMGEQDVFARRFHVAGQNVALTLLVDLSSSMNRGLRCQAATSLAVALAQSAEQAGARVDVYGFWCGRGATDMTAHLLQLKGGNDRTSAEQTQLSLGAIPQLARGGTALAPAILQCAQMLDNNAQATRRILMVLSDGACSTGGATVALAVRMAYRQHRTETLAFALGEDMPASAFNAMFGTKVVYLGNKLKKIDLAAFETLAHKLEHAAVPT